MYTYGSCAAFTCEEQYSDMGQASSHHGKSYHSESHPRKLRLQKKLIEAVKQGNVPLLERLLILNVPADITGDVKTGSKSTLMYLSKYLCSNKGRVDTAIKVAELLIVHGADVTHTDSAGCHVMYYFLKTGQRNLLKLFVEKGLDINSVNPVTQCTVLENCVYKSCAVDILELLLELGANVNTKHRNGVYLFQHCVKQGNLEGVKVLVKYGADVNLVDNESHRTALHSLVCDYSSDTSGNAHSLDIAHCLLEAGTNVNNIDTEGQTVLHDCISIGKGLELVHAILCKGRLGCDVNIRNRQGDTVLHLFYQRYGMSGDLDRTLINCGAQVNIKNLSEQHPISTCISIVAYSGSFMVQGAAALKSLIQKLLLHIDAGLDVRSLHSTTSLLLSDMVTKSQNMAIVETLHECGLRFFALQESVQFSWVRPFVERTSHEPLSLKRCSANVLRSSLQPNAVLGLPLLDIPPQIKEYIAMKHLRNDFNF